MRNERLRALRAGASVRPCDSSRASEKGGSSGATFPSRASRATARRWCARSRSRAATSTASWSRARSRSPTPFALGHECVGGRDRARRRRARARARPARRGVVPGELRRAAAAAARDAPRCASACRCSPTTACSRSRASSTAACSRTWCACRSPRRCCGRSRRRSTRPRWRASPTTCPTATAPWRRTSPRSPGSEVLVASHGTPSIPLYAAQAALALGASRVDFASSDRESLALAENASARGPSRPTSRESRARTYPIVVDAGVTPAGSAMRCPRRPSPRACTRA